MTTCARIALTAAALASLAACFGPPPPARLAEGEASANPTGLFPEEVALPYADLGMTTDRVDVNGKPARVACRTCHDKLIRPSPKNTMATKLGTFHLGVELRHGDLTCQGCHNPPAFQDYRLAGGQAVTYANVLQLCNQCHGQRVRDYHAGLHGGMSGYWDRTRGPRLRNHCLHCHDAHRPAVLPMQPAPLPRSRTIDAAGGHDEHGA